MWKNHKSFTLVVLLAALVILFVCPPPCMAGPGSGELISFTQPDGRVFQARILGDEFSNWVETAEGYTIIQNGSTQFWEYAVKESNGRLIGSGIIVDQVPITLPDTIMRGVRPDPHMTPTRSYNEMESSAAPWVNTPVSGSRNVLIILVSYADRSLSTTAASWNTSVFSTSAKAVAKFFNDNSFNNFSIVPVSHTQSGDPGVISVTLATNHPNYGGTFTFSQDQQLGNAALAQASSFIDFNLYDTNGDGILQTSELCIYFIHAGYERSGSTKTPNVWAHAWRTTATGLTAGSKNVQRWALNGELNNNDVQHPMGVIAHEMGHQICELPDLYDTNSHNGGLGNFSLMAGGSWGADTGEESGTTPVALDAWSREYLGWTVPQTSASGAVTLNPPLQSNTSAIKLVKTSFSTTEYFLMENRYPTGWDLGIRGKTGFGSTWQGGLLIIHVDNAVGSNAYVSGGHQGVMAEQASTAACNMLTTTCRGDKTTLFYSGNNSNWDSMTNPNSAFYNGTASDFSVTSISAPATGMTMTIGEGGVINGVCGSSNGQTFATAPTTNLCSAGTATAVSGSGPWTWSCIGSSGGSTASCSANKTGPHTTFTTGAYGNNANITDTLSIPGATSLTVTVTGNTEAGYDFIRIYNSSNVLQKSLSGYGINQTFTVTGSSINVVFTSDDSVTASGVTVTIVALPINGVCGSSNGQTFAMAPATNLCSAGTATAVSGSGPWTWSCTGSNGGSTASCSANKTGPRVTGVCGSSDGRTLTTAPTTNLCDAGTATAVSGNGPWTWSCTGSNGGSTASCLANKTGPPGIQIISPNGGESWTTGSTHAITWTSSNLHSASLIHIYLYNNDVWQQIAGPLSPFETSYSWVVPNTPATSSIVWVGNRVNNAWQFQDQNDQPFTITKTGSNAPLYFPHIDTSLPWQTEIAIINTSSDQTVTGALRGFSNDGQLIEAKAVTLFAHGRRQITVADEFTNHLNIGYIIFETDSATVQGYTKLYQAGIYRAAIPAVKVVNTSDIYISHIDSSAQWWTGLTLVNTTSETKNLTITFNNGVTVPYTLNPNQRRVFTIGSLLNQPLQPNIRSAVITNASGVIGLELFGSIGSATQMEGILLTDKTASTIYYPHVDSNGWWTGIVAYNPAESACTITITPYSAQGAPLSPSTLSIAGKGKYVGIVSELGLPAQTAWFKIDSTRPLSGFELFSTADGNQLAAYAESGGTGSKAGIFAKIEKNGGWTGIAFVNTEGGAASVTLTAYNDSGTVVATQVLPVGGHAKVVHYAEAIFMQDISGATYIAYSSDRNVVGFQLNGTLEGMMLDALPGLDGTN